MEALAPISSCAHSNATGAPFCCSQVHRQPGHHRRLADQGQPLRQDHRQGLPQGLHQRGPVQAAAEVRAPSLTPKLCRCLCRRRPADSWPLSPSGRPPGPTARASGGTCPRSRASAAAPGALMPSRWCGKQPSTACASSRRPSAWARPVSGAGGAGGWGPACLFKIRLIGLQHACPAQQWGQPG
jgi:hypothetical protein